MNLITLKIKYFISILVLVAGQNAYSQDTSYLILENKPRLFIHDSAEKDQKLFDSVGYLINAEPSLQNHEIYLNLAESLWELNKLEEAKKMFVNIINSQKPFYQNDYHYSSDIPGDTTKNIYGYGSFTYNYKNSACVYLTRIYIEQNKFDTAINYLNEAVNKYKVSYSCGTGYHMQQERYRYLYGLCYEGLGMEKELFDLLIPYCFDWQNETIIRAIKKKYSKIEIKKYLDDAINSIDCKLDDKQSSTFITTNSGEKDEKTIEIKYYGGTGTMYLFGRKIDLQNPVPENGQRLSRQYFVKMVKESSFYLNLIE